MTELSPSELFVTARLWTQKGHQEKRSSVLRALRPYVPADEVEKLLGSAVESGMSRGFLAGLTHGRVKLQQSGVKAVRSALEVSGKNSPSWRTVRDVGLVARALSLPAPKSKERDRLQSASGLRAVIVAADRKLGLGAFPTSAQVQDALAWRRLGDLCGEQVRIQRGTPFGAGAGRQFLVASALGDMRTSGRASDPLSALAAAAVGAPRAELAGLRTGVLRRWLEPKPTTQQTAPVCDGRSLEAFADEVLAAAADCREGRFAENLVFIVDVWKAFAKRRAGRDLDETGFKRSLVEANKNMLISLQRADLIPAMDRERVSASTINHMGGTFHFLRTDFQRHES